MRMIARSLGFTSLFNKLGVNTVFVLRHCSSFIARRMVHQRRQLDCPTSGPSAGELIIPDYKESVRTLNSLQSNASVLERSHNHPLEAAMHNVPATVTYLAQIGISVDELDKLNIIHVSGTKGKGSTCAFCESILRKHGLRTGFFSSPHIVAVRERIRINGQPLSESSFANYFSEVYNRLIESNSGDGMPPYFKFLTVMAFHTFLKEKVDVAIIEVGIGGQYDCTNAIRKPIVCGVTSLGLDHTRILGTTLDKIAWQKAGIFKPGIPAITVQQKHEAMKTLEERAVKIGAPLSIAPALESHSWHGLSVVLGLAGEVQRQNASLAVQLVLTWFQRKHLLDQLEIPNAFHRSPCESLTNVEPSYDLMNSIAAGLRDCLWPGRHQILHRGSVVYFLDGAHTPESMLTCAEWFNQASNDEQFCHKEKVSKILLFNSTGFRSPESLLTPLLQCNFDCAVFCTNVISSNEDSSSDTASMTVSNDHSFIRCELHEKTWEKLVGKMADHSHNAIFSCISDALTYITTKAETTFPENSKLHVLVVGSLHLVGGVLSIFDPELELSKSHN